MRRICFMLAVMAVFISISASEVSDSACAPAYRNIYAELMGASDVVGLSYDARFYPGCRFGYRAGLSYFAEDSQFMFAYRGRGVGMPLGVNCILGNRRSKFEIGPGISMGYYSFELRWLNIAPGSNSWIIDFKSTTHRFGYFCFCDIGYRYQRESGFMFRVGLTPVFDFGGKYAVETSNSLRLYISFGYTL